MELTDALRTTGAVREFTDEPVPDEVVARVLENARFAPSGGNRQGWRVIVLRDPTLRAAVRDLYLAGWYEYLAQRAAGLTPWAPVTDRDAEAAAVAKAGEVAEAAAAGPGGFAEHLDTVPVLLVVLAVGGASVYPFVWSVLLAAREEGLGGVLTTMPIRREPELREVLGVPDELAVAAVVALGHPLAALTRLRRSAVDAFTTLDRADGPTWPPS